jgi:two-component system OmpR family sensor kinase
MTKGAPSPLHGDELEYVSAALALEGSLDEALSQIMQRTCDLLDVYQASFFLAEWPGPRLRLMATSTGLPTDPVIMEPSQGVEGWVARRNRPFAVANPGGDARFAPYEPWSGPPPGGVLLAAAAVPVRTSAGLVGVLSVLDQTGAEAESPGEHPLGAAAIGELLPFLVVLADLVALALENNVILQRQERRTQFIRLLHTIATVPASEPTEVLAQTIANQFCAITKAEVASILLHSSTTDELVALGLSDTPLGRVQRELGHDHFPLAVSGPLLQVFQHGTAMLLGPGAAAEAIPLAAAARLQSILLVPLQVEGERQGLIFLGSTRAEAFSEDDLSFTSFISVRLSYALHHKTLADDLATLEQERIQQDARESFITIVAHDLKNALMVISGTGHLALRKATRGDTTYSQKALPVIVQKAAQAIQLVNDMVDVNNVDHGRLRLFIAPVELVALLREEVEAAQGLSEQHTLTLDTTLETLEIAADGQRLRQVLGNLLANAIRYSPAGGVIRVALTRLAQEPPAAAPAADLPQAIRLTVADQGMGITPEDLPHIFDRFFRGRGEQVASGSGLGLYIASAIVIQHGGRIWGESQPETVGTTFHVTLPEGRSLGGPG